MVPPSSDQVSRVWPYSGICAALSVFTYVVLTLSDRPSHAVRLTDRVLKAVRTPEVFLLPVCPLPRSLATTYGISFDVSSSPYLDGFSSGGSPDVPILNFSTTYLSMNPGEFPHSEISGSMLICSSPKLIAAYHVFHRLPVPRHSPCALVRLTISNKSLSRSACILLILSCQRRLCYPSF